VYNTESNKKKNEINKPLSLDLNVTGSCSDLNL
jgi:hypothetical protein